MLPNDEFQVAVAGGRKYHCNISARCWLEETLKNIKATRVLSGMYGNSDLMGYEVGTKMGLTDERSKFPPLWKEYGLRAGPIRNTEMIKVADCLIYFPGNKGTKDVVDKAESKGIPILSYAEYTMEKTMAKTV